MLNVTYCCRTAMTRQGLTQDLICSVCGSVYTQEDLDEVTREFKLNIAALGQSLDILLSNLKCKAHRLTRHQPCLALLQAAVVKLNPNNKNVIRVDALDNNMIVCVAHQRYIHDCQSCLALCQTTYLAP